MRLLKSPIIAWVCCLVMSACAIVSSLYLVDATERMIVLRDIALEAVDMVQEVSDSPPKSIEVMTEPDTGDVYVRVDGQHHFKFEKACPAIGTRRF